MQKIKVLYAEDDKEWQAIMREIITMLGYEIDIVSTVKDAKYMLRRSTYHIALLDKRLDENNPENDDGLNLASIVSSLDEGTQIIVYTAYGNIEDAREAFKEIRVRDFIGKNRPLDEIRKALKEAADNAVIEFNLPTRMTEKILQAKEGALDEFLSIFPEKPGLTTRREDLELFARRLIGEYRPLLPDLSEAKIVLPIQILVLQTRFWSKALGFPIAAWFGKYWDMKTAQETIFSDRQLLLSLGINSIIKDLFDPNIFPDYGGVVFKLEGAELDEFESQLKIHS